MSDLTSHSINIYQLDSTSTSCPRSLRDLIFENSSARPVCPKRHDVQVSFEHNSLNFAGLFRDLAVSWFFKSRQLPYFGNSTASLANLWPSVALAHFRLYQTSSRTACRILLLHMLPKLWHEREMGKAWQSSFCTQWMQTSVTWRNPMTTDLQTRIKQLSDWESDRVLKSPQDFVCHYTLRTGLERSLWTDIGEVFFEAIM